MSPTARLNSPHRLAWSPMDTTHVLLALEEQRKWRERRKRIRERMRQLERRRATLRKELEGVRRKIFENNRILADMKEGSQPRAISSMSQLR